MKHILKPLVCICLIAFTGRLHAQALQEDYQKIAGNFALAYSGIAEKGYRMGYINTPITPKHIPPETSTSEGWNTAM